ncbi:SET and MYND domain-containing protein 4 [Madurella mycetomatis]|uniref:SET and MYND domain-containing protein 4 n=1 Tax=Madurella mycetomatis TaxID=100816 RepID=A0A175W7A7_9PEZI|nr:SET and MYND domain-containing protein 4 [Madurella mycetomatis]
MAVVVAAPSTSMAATKEAAGAVPTRRPTREELINTHKTHLKKQDNSPNAPRPVKQPILSDAYPASTKSIRELEIIPLSELRAESHHRGKGIIVKAISSPYVSAGAVSIVEDEFGNADKLAIYNQADSSILSGVPEGCVVAVKEPYYKNNGSANDFMICVDHPSDVILLRFTDPIIPEPLRLGPLLKTAEDWRKAGDTAFIEKDFPTAVFCYTEALETSSDPAFKSPIYTKRAGTNLVLGRYDAAKADALASLMDTPSPHDWKAYYNAGRAAYGLCDYPSSHSLLSKALELNPTHSGIQKEHARCQARLREEETGEYDFPAMLASLGPRSVHLDRGSFLRNTRVAESPHHGRGLPATIVFVEKATLLPNQYEPLRASAALYALMVRQLCDNPSLAGPVLQLYPGGHERSGLEGTMVDGVPVVDVFLIEAIRTKNCFSSPRSTLEDTKPSTPNGRLAKGLWLHSSYLNHNCVPNTMRSFLGDILISRATRDIKEGEELYQQYVPVKSLPDVRNKQYKDSWGFECGCALCSGERRSSDGMLAKRKEALAAVEKLCNKKLPGKELIPDATIRNVDRLAKQLEELHEPEIYEGLPRLTLIYPCNWLIGAHRGRKNHTKVIKYALKVLRNFGFRVPEEECAAWDPREIYASSGDATLMTVHVVASLRRLAEAYEALGQKEMAERCLEAAEFGYMLVTGFKNDLSMLDR